MRNDALMQGCRYNTAMTMCQVSDPRANFLSKLDMTLHIELLPGLFSSESWGQSCRVDNGVSFGQVGACTWVFTEFYSKARTVLVRVWTHD